MKKTQRFIFQEISSFVCASKGELKMTKQYKIQAKVNFKNEIAPIEEIDVRLFSLDRIADFNKKFLDKELQKAIGYEEKPIGEDKISKIERMSDLKKTKRPLRYLHKMVDGVSHSGYFGGLTELFEENDEVKIRVMEERKRPNMRYDTKFGTLVCEDFGEFGGLLYTDEDDRQEVLGTGNYMDIIEYGDKVFALTSLEHMASNECSLHEIRKNDEGNLENICIFETNDLAFSEYVVEENYIYFYSASYNFFKHYDTGGLYRFDLSNYELELLSEDFREGIDISSLIKKDNLVYVYGEYNIFKYDLSTGELETFTNLNHDEIGENWYIGKERLLDVWDDIIEE